MTFDYRRLSLTELNSILKVVHPDVNSHTSADEITGVILEAREYVKNLWTKCKNCGKPVRKRKKGRWVGEFCCVQCKSLYQQRGVKDELPEL